MIKLVKDWNKKNRKCCACGTTKSVKYDVKTTKGSDEWVPCCNKCAALIDYEEIVEDCDSR